MFLIIALILIGVGLLAAETILPGLIAGALGLLCLAGAVVIAFMDFGFEAGMVALAAVVIILIVGTALWLKYFPDSKVGQMFIDKGKSGERSEPLPDLTGKTGTAETDLRPAGVVMIDGRRVDVIAENRMVRKGSLIKVTSFDGVRVVVREIDYE